VGGPGASPPGPRRRSSLRRSAPRRSPANYRPRVSSPAGQRRKPFLCARHYGGTRYRSPGSWWGAKPVPPSSSYPRREADKRHWRAPQVAYHPQRDITPAANLADRLATRVFDNFMPGLPTDAALRCAARRRLAYISSMTRAFSTTASSKRYYAVGQWPLTSTSPAEVAPPQRPYLTTRAAEKRHRTHPPGASRGTKGRSGRPAPVLRALCLPSPGSPGEGRRASERGERRRDVRKAAAVSTSFCASRPQAALRMP